MPTWYPSAEVIAAHCYGCTFVHDLLDGFNAEVAFRVWVTIPYKYVTFAFHYIYLHG